MCGIIGVFGKQKAEEQVIKGMKLISYRGQDGYGLYSNAGCIYSDFISFDSGNSDFAIGHCLHAVVNKVKQPFVARGVFAINCEIYNWKELSGIYNIDVGNDAELFFLLLEKLGVEKTLELVDGDYAGVYFRDDKVYLFRDRIGVKPIWYSFDDGLAFASEKKVLKELSGGNIFELNPREMLVYDVKNKDIKFVNLKFYDVVRSDDNYDAAKKRVGGYLVNSISMRVPDVKFGLLFSGALDSGFIALVLKKFDVDFVCYTCVVKDSEKVPEDLEYARKVANYLGLNLRVVEVSLDEIERELPLICKLIESNNVTKVSVAVSFYFACKKANDDGVKVIFSGLGADDLFGGYSRHLKSNDINKECYHSLLNIYERDLYRDDVITMYNKIELRVPYLDSRVVAHVLSIDGKYKINEKGNKVILRDVALDYGLPKDFSFRKKMATQYGGNFLRAIEKLSRRRGFKSKSQYLGSFYNDGNVKLAALFSSGKDSCYAMGIMKRQNYSIKCLVTIKSKNKDSYMYHTPNVHVAELQAEALGLPIIMQDSSGEKELELDDLERALVKAKRKYGVEGIVAGAIFSSYQRDRVQMIAEKLGLKVFIPLWHKDQESLLRELVANDFEVIISSVASDGLDESWLGRKLDEKMIENLVDLNKKNCMNIAFEGGEAETLVLDCPMFKKRLIVEEAELIMSSKHSGIYNIKKIKCIDKLN